MNCETCRGVVIGSGFFMQIVHENDCAKVKVYLAEFRKIGFPDIFRRCAICKENMVPIGLMCEDCTREARVQA